VSGTTATPISASSSSIKSRSEAISWLRSTSSHVREASCYPFAVLTVIPRQQLFSAQIAEVDFVARCQRMVLVDDELKVFREQRPGVESLPLLADLGGNAELGFTPLENSATSRALPRRKRNSRRLNIRLIWSRCGISSDRSTEWVSAILSAPTSPLLKDEASSRAPVAAHSIA